MDVENHRFFIGTKSGVLLSLHNNFKTTEFWKTEKNSGITIIENGRNTDELLLGHENGTISIFSISGSTLSKTITDLDGKQRITGIGIIHDSIVSSKLDGIINIWTKDDNVSFPTNVPTDGNLNVMAVNPSNHLIATGGENNQYQLWDLNRRKSVFKAKSLGNDMLQLRIPISIRDICFFESKPSLGACCTKEGRVLLYDSKAQRKATVKLLEEKASYTTIATLHRETQVAVGTTKGYLQIMDLRSPGKVLTTFTKFFGGITDISCDKKQPYITSVGLDRFLRVFNLETKELVHKHYLQQRLTALLVRDVFDQIKIESDLETEKTVSNTKKRKIDTS